MKKRPTRIADDDEGLEALFDLGGKKFLVTCGGPEEGPFLYNVYLFSEITGPKQFTDVIECLQVATEEDTVLIHLSTPGGDIDATDTFLHALKGSRARVVFNASGGVHSAGTLILMHAKEIVFSTGFNALVHNGSVGFGCKFSDWESATEFTRKHMKKLFNETYEGFLTPKEIEELIAGKDFWLDADAFKKRLLKRNRLLKDK